MIIAILYILGCFWIVANLVTFTVGGDKGQKHYLGAKHRAVFPTNLYSNSSKFMSYSRERNKYLRIAKYITPIPYYIHYKRFTSKNLKVANKIVQCWECNKYSRGYQAAFIAEYEATCVHCGGGLKSVKVDPSVAEFLEDFPECPKIDAKGLQAIVDWAEAKDNNAVVVVTNKEIQRVMDSYKETGNLYMQELYKKDSTK